MVPLLEGLLSLIGPLGVSMLAFRKFRLSDVAHEGRLIKLESGNAQSKLDFGFRV